MKMKCFKKSISIFLALCLALSALTCLAMADDENGSETEEPAVTVYITSDTTEIRPGYDTTIDVAYTISPVTNLRSFRMQVSIPDELLFDHLLDVVNLSDRMFNGNGDVGYSTYSTVVTGQAYGDGFTCESNFTMFSARYSVPADATDGEVTFDLETAVFAVQGGAAEVKVEPLTIPIVVVDTSALQIQIENAKTMLNLRDLYSEASVEALEEALAAAENIIENIGDYYQSDVDQALDDLTAALNGLKNPSQELDAAIEAAGQLRESDYTADSWGNLMDAVEAAKEIRNSENPTNDELNGAADAIYAAIDELVPVEDPVASSREALEQLLQDAKELSEADYSESTWTALQNAIENAENVLSDENATKEELDEAYDALALAMSRAQLEVTIEMAKLLNESDYDADSWAALQAAIAAAEEVLNDENATKQELDDAYEALIEAMGTGGNSSGSSPDYYSGNVNNGSSGGVVTSPQTGDSDLLLMCMIILTVGLGACAAVCVSKARGTRE